MAKKSGVQQLQTEINTTDDLLKFLERDGLIVLDIFTEWCGPCLAMVGSLKKIKLEHGGDDLHLAIVKCDNIDVFRRFRNKSEPTWLLASKGKLVNSAFGSNVPQLVEMILKELEIERATRDPNATSAVRQYYELGALTPLEQTYADDQAKVEETNDNMEMELCQRKCDEYLTYVTDTVTMHANDMGVTILMPHVMSRDLLKRLSDAADKCSLVVKDKKNIRILPEHIDIIGFGCTNPMPTYLLDHVMDRDIFAVCWKVADNNTESRKDVEEYLNTFVKVVWNENEPNGAGGNASLLKSLSVLIETEEDEICAEVEQNAIGNEGDEINENVPANSKTALDGSEVGSDKNVNDDENDGTIKMCPESEQIEQNTEKNEENSSQPQSLGADRNEQYSPNLTNSNKAEKKKNVVKMEIPPIWAPVDQRTNSALVYLYFRSLTETFLPPDPPVQRPHYAFAYDAYKYREIMEVIEIHREDVLAYGYFTTDNPETAQLIANSTFNYVTSPPTIYDKFVLKVAKSKGSQTIAAFTKLSPCAVSGNTVDGEAECLVYFPRGYKNASETGETTPIPVEQQSKRRKRKRKTKTAADGSDEKAPDDNAQLDGEQDVEDTTEQDDDDEEENSLDDNETENAIDPIDTPN